jgi:3-deoxy-7-phosphoheptulonate synthase
MSSVPPVDNLNVTGLEEMPTPDQVKTELPLPDAAALTVAGGRAAIQRILDREDPRLMVVIGPCSIHDPGAAIEYASRLRRLADRVRDTLFLVMRVYFEKPRTSTGWKGFVNDPLMDDSFRIDEGIVRARRLLLEFAKMGLPAGSEALDPLSPQYIGDLISWYTIGARTTESQTHREMASGLSAPVGFKNGTDGGLGVAVNAMLAAAQQHSFLGIDNHGQVGVVRTAGNPHTHLVLRGGAAGPNYDAASVERAAEALARAGVNRRMLIDASHDNSRKNHERQAEVVSDVGKQVRSGSPHVLGVMLESNLVAGRQELKPGLPLVYGQSVTDACLAWDDTLPVLDDLAKAVRARREKARA